MRMISHSTPPQELRGRFVIWLTQVGRGKQLAYALMVAVLVSGASTYFAMTASAPLHLQRTNTIFWLLNLDLVLLLVLGVIVGRRMAGLWSSRKRGMAGARLQGRVVLVFSALVAVPAILTAMFSAIFFYVGVQSWFSDRVTTAVDESLAVAQAYLHEHQQAIRADALAMANDLNREAPWIMGSTTALNHVVRTQALTRNLTEALVIDGSGHTIAKTGFAMNLELDPLDPTEIERARDGEVLIITNKDNNRVRALIRLDRFVDTFLYVGRRVEPDVLSQISAAQNAVVEYKQLEGRSSEIQIKITMIFLVIALLLLMAAVWLGILFAKQLVTPIAALIDAAELVRAGDLNARVAEGGAEDEIATLSRAFNRMTSQLQGQRQDLIEANQQLDLRRRFTEAVLAGVSAGVIGLDVDGRVSISNISAAEFLGMKESELSGRYLADFVPQIEDLLRTATPNRITQAQFELTQGQSLPRTVLARVTTEYQSGQVRGYVVTFDDLTELTSAQRKAAWADVARRIAHEIKNPLTPIQLSAERLKRKYGAQITTDRQIFDNCTDTIIRHVGDIGRMVDEFSAFARMPAPVIKHENLTDLCRQLVGMRGEVQPGISFDLQTEGTVLAECDGRQLGQALTNLLQNAIESVESRLVGESVPQPGHIKVSLINDAGLVTIAVVDNGKGLPSGERERLTEPYVTTRAKGTGLGLAIVKKIMEDHHGRLELDDVPDGGAVVKLIFPQHYTVSS
jgi:two-component system nitrogen regulation sensor histidine kinase NtrY